MAGIEEDVVRDVGTLPISIRTGSRTSAESATAETGRFSGSSTSKVTRAAFGSSAPRQRRGRNAAIGVSARMPAPIGRIGPCAE